MSETNSYNNFGMELLTILKLKTAHVTWKEKKYSLGRPTIKKYESRPRGILSVIGPMGLRCAWTFSTLKKVFAMILSFVLRAFLSAFPFSFIFLSCQLQGLILTTGFPVLRNLNWEGVYLRRRLTWSSQVDWRKTVLFTLALCQLHHMDRIGTMKTKT